MAKIKIDFLLFAWVFPAVAYPLGCVQAGSLTDIISGVVPVPGVPAPTEIPQKYEVNPKVIPSVGLQNRSNVTLRLQILEKDLTPCGGEIVIGPKERKGYAPCGDYLGWNNGADNSYIRISIGHFYEIYWNDKEWSVRDVTEEVQ